MLEVKAMELVAGSPEGEVFPKESFAVRVTVREEPELTVPLEAVTMLVAVE